MVVSPDDPIGVGVAVAIGERPGEAASRSPRHADFHGKPRFVGKDVGDRIAEDLFVDVVPAQAVGRVVRFKGIHAVDAVVNQRQG